MVTPNKIRLAELNPIFYSSGGEGISRKNKKTGASEPVPERKGMGILFDCPCGCKERAAIPLTTESTAKREMLHGIEQAPLLNILP